MPHARVVAAASTLIIRDDESRRRRGSERVETATTGRRSAGKLVRSDAAARTRRLQALLGQVQDNEQAKLDAKAEVAAREAELDAMSVGERIRYERAMAAKANKEGVEEAMRKLNVVGGSQDAADAKPSQEYLRNPPKAM